jgi:hypothetical protein
VKDATVRRLVAMTVASAPSSCAVCSGEESADYDRSTVGEFGSAAWFGGSAPCPHCQLGLPIAHLPMRVDRPREESA